MKQIKLIGAGGIGTALLPFLSRYLNFSGAEARLTIIDGDSFEKKNEKRQDFKEIGNKAKVKAEELALIYENVSFRAVKEFVTAENVGDLIQDGDIVLLGVDNHRTRKIISEHCETLSETYLISGGNELTDGNVQVYVRKDGKNITVPLTRFHPEIANPKDKSPGEMSCEEKARQPESKQIIVTNMFAAALMFAALWNIDQGNIEKLGEYYFDIIEGVVQNLSRKEEA